MIFRSRYAVLAAATLLWGAGAVSFPFMRAIPFPLCVTAAVLIERSVSLKTITSLLAAGIVFELVWALPHGTLIGPQVVAAAVMVLAERTFIVPHLVATDSWALPPMVMRVAVGTLSVIAGISSWAFAAALVAHRSVAGVASTLGDGTLWAGTAVVVFILLAVLHRSRVPFRKRIRFGSPYA